MLDCVAITASLSYESTRCKGFSCIKDGRLGINATGKKGAKILEWSGEQLDRQA